ncbi:MAG: ABC transporter permease [Coriobacteriales bacterium]
MSVSRAESILRALPLRPGAAGAAAGDPARLGEAISAELGVRQRLLTAANVLFVALLLVSELMPDAAGADPCAPYLYVVAAAVAGVQLAACALARERGARDSAADVGAVIMAVLLAWLLCTAKLGILPAKMFPAPGEVFAQIAADRAMILEGVGSSLSIVAEGFVLGGACALVLGLALGFGARSSSCAGKVASFLSAIPPIVYIPYGIALLPTFRSCSVMVIFLATFWPVLAGTLAGVAGVDKRAVDSARVLNVGKLTMLTRVVLPDALPLIFNGLNIGLTLSFILLTSAEMIGGRTGMGYYVRYYSDFGDYTRILAGIIVIGVVITTISLLFGKLQRHLTRWR